jgi:dipeptidyl aminopeptidase/acylaminoacyl peptidase
MVVARSLVASWIALASVCTAAAAAETERHPFSVEDLVRLKRVAEPALSPDGKTVVFTVRETDIAANRGRQDLWSLDLATKGAQPRRLTTDPENDNSPDWSRDGRYVYFISSRNGSAQVWRLAAAGGEAEQVTSLPLDVGSFRLAPDGTRLLVSMDVFADCGDLACTSSRLKEVADSKATGKVYDRTFVRHWDTWSDGRISQLFVLRVDNGRAVEPRSLTAALDADVPSKPFGDASEYTFSPDGSKVVFDARIKGKSEPWSTNFDLYEVSVEGGEPRNLTADNPAWDAQPVFSPDGTMMAWRAMQRPGFEADRFHVMIADLKSGERRELAQDWDRSADQIEFSADGRTLYAVADHFGQRPVWAIDVKTGKTSMLTGPGHVDAFAVGEREIVYAVSSLKSPAELYAVTLKGGDLRELPRMNAAAFAQLQIGEPEQFTFAGAKGETVYGYVMRPANYDPKRRYPVAFIVHGGPQSSFGNGWSYRWNPQTYAGAGYGSIFIDFHGSPGYGQAFTDSISQDWGGKPLEDLQKGLQAALERYQWLDGDRMCALGASYGGYMMNWIAGNWNEPFKCIVSHAGIFDTRGMGYMTEELWFAEWENGGTPWEVPQNYEQFNPLDHVGEWQKPMLVIAGQNDYRVPYSQSLSMFNALQRRGIPSRLMIFPNENHWVLKPANSIQWHREVEKWLEQWTTEKGE